MRKRIVIGLFAMVVIGMAAFFLSQPKMGSVEWHKRKYLDAWKRLNEQTLADKVKNFLNRIAGRKVTTQFWSRENHERVQSHRAALLTLGYLDQQAFDFTNCSRAQVLSSPAFAFAHRGSQREFVMITIQDTNTLHIIAVREDMPLFVEAIRKVEKP